MLVGDIMHREVTTVRGDEDFAAAARLMHERHISSLIVTDGSRPAGILTERDVVNVVAEGLDPAATRVRDRMSTDLATVTPRDDVAEAARLMAERGIRHLPVVRKDDLVGIISIRDLITWAVEELTGGHELADVARGATTLSHAVRAERRA